MKASPLERNITEAIAPVIEDLGFALVCVNITGDNGQQNVQVMAEDPKTKRLGVDDCASISRAVAATLDVEDPISGKYNLEVSSPGIDRPLMSEQDFEEYSGFEAKIETDTPAENGQRRFRGVLQGMNESNIVLMTDQGEVKIPFGALNKAKLVLTDDLIKRSANL